MKKLKTFFFQTKTPSRIRFRESANAVEEASLLSDTFDDDEEEQQQPQPQQHQQQQQQPARVQVH